VWRSGRFSPSSHSRPPPRRRRARSSGRRGRQAEGAAVAARQAESGAAGAQAATIGIVDSDIDSSHPDLSGRVATGFGANCINPAGDCSAGSAMDDNGHGTHVAGIAGAGTNNLVGVAGTAFDTQLIPVKVLDASNTGSYAAITNGIIWATQHGAKVINLSILGSFNSQTLCDAVNQAYSSGIVIVAAAGNSASSAPNYPAACPHALGVAGDSIYSTFPKAQYKTMSGTSMSTPFVAGLASQLLGELPSRTPTDIAEILATTSDKVGSGYGADPYGTCSGCSWNSRYGYGRINMARALAAADFALTASPRSATVTQGGQATFTVSVHGVNGYSGAVSLAVDGTPLGWLMSFDPSSVSPGGSSTLTVNTFLLSAPGTYTLTITGTSGATVRSAQITLVLLPVIAAGGGSTAAGAGPQPPASPPPVSTAPPDFSMSITPSAKRTKPGLPQTFTIVLTTPSGAGVVDLSVSGLPPGAGATLVPQSTSAPGASTLTVSPALTTPSGSYTFTVTGTSGGLTRTATAVIVVQP